VFLLNQDLAAGNRYRGRIAQFDDAKG